jgi:4-hydroxy-L-threonine phosphate dehydrogenase PdxA
VTTHVALCELPTIITEELVLKRLQTTWKFLVDSNIEQSIAVCGLNPHAGENGVLGNEESKHIIPAMEMARKEGIKCEGPYPADTLFIESKRKNYGAILAMYHDQGGIPFKMLSFDHGVNHTLGLPIIRTSVDHGTGWDIAWQGKASPKSLESAIKMAMTLAKAKSISNP